MLTPHTSYAAWASSHPESYQLRAYLLTAVEPSSSNNLASADWERYSLRAADKFPFLHPDKIKDASGKRPGEPGYNPRTLLIPPSWFKDAKISEGRRQW